METYHSDRLALVSHLRHELRTPINAIIGYSEMLLEDLETEGEPETLALLEQIHGCGGELLVLINRHLDSCKFNDDNIDLTHLSETLPVSLEPSLTMAIAICEKLSGRVGDELAIDLDKIYKAACCLRACVSDLHTLAKDYLSTDTTPPKASAEIKLTTSNETKSKNSWGKILVVDDNENNRDLLSRHIKGQGYTVATAANGREAIQMIQTGDYDLLLLDILMPEMNGYEVLQWLKDNDFRHLRAIAISALDELDSVVKCIEMGAEDYLTKPFNSVLLRARIEACLEKKRLRDREVEYLAQLALANQEISILNERLQAENLRLSTELEITRRLQQMMLPKDNELSQIEGLEIAGYMEPADEVGGDYYDVLQTNGRVKIGIGDVTGHGLESGVLMIMVQTAVRTLMENNETDPKKFLEALNRTIYNNVQRMSSNKNLTLSLVDYHNGKLDLSGQHEELIVVRANGELERIDTIDLGFPIGLEESIVDFVAQTQIHLKSGDVVVLYTDGVTEAENSLRGHYGIDRLCEVIKQNCQKSAIEIRHKIIEDVRQHIGHTKVYDDITLVVLKQK
ncbi:MAG: SpoIIE family protein phosphatase [Hydrococcus sp. Prado102]|jgi:sigma-B regulation protein RsbU (phosphoserine phosphatase)|nr:SpoIIE family protein phosphatase [Hydrococcus sp. Prado102]